MLPSNLLPSLTDMPHPPSPINTSPSPLQHHFHPPPPTLPPTFTLGLPEGGREGGEGGGRRLVISKLKRMKVVLQATPSLEKRVWYFAIAWFVLVPHDKWGC
jgi:hypothetical protein